MVNKSEGIIDPQKISNEEQSQPQINTEKADTVGGG